MARLNVEDSFWLDVISVVAKLGDQDRAIGNAIRFFRHAQEKHKAGQLVSEEEFTLNEFSEALFPRFAERVPGGIRVVGADKHFGWLRDRVEAGRKGGSKPKQVKAKPSKTKQPEASPSPSYSSSLSVSDSSVGEAVAEAPAPSAPVGNELVSEFYSCWRAKHGGKAPLLPPDHKKLKDLGDQLGNDRAKMLVRAYFKVADKWFETKQHDVQTLMSNLSKVQAFVDRNQARPSTIPPSGLRYDAIVGPTTDPGARSLSFDDILSMVPKHLGGQKNEGA